MKTMTVTAWGETCEVYIRKDLYLDGNTCLTLYTTEGEGYSTITVNLQTFGNPKLAAIDTNNCKFAEELISTYKLGKDTGMRIPSGFCVYPVYELDLKEIDKYT